MATRNELPPQAPDAQMPDAALPDAPPDAPPPRPIVADASVDAPPPVTHKGTISGRVFRKNPGGEEYPQLWVSIYNLDDNSVYRTATTDSAKKGAYELTDVPPGSYKLNISDHHADWVLDVVVKRDQKVKLDVDLNRVPMRRRPPKPYGAPPARRRVV